MFKSVQKLVQKRWQSAGKNQLVLPTYHSLAVKILTNPGLTHSFSAADTQIFPAFTHSNFSKITVSGGSTSPLSTHINKEATSF